jgi:hypothetical protein
MHLILMVHLRRRLVLVILVLTPQIIILVLHFHLLSTTEFSPSHNILHWRKILSLTNLLEEFRRGIGRPPTATVAGGSKTFRRAAALSVASVALRDEHFYQSLWRLAWW